MYTIAGIVSEIIYIYSWVLIIYILMSWVPNIQNSSIGQLFARVSEPFLQPFRKIIPPIGGMIDISPIVAFFVLRLAGRGVYELAYLLS
ncbi:YggT family protein [Scopulibacillus darangshiensis]|uniref:YggT family protein n=1 Tax=Scopulibacillus darangshiensis TaxID=442528 RepID=A0A4V2SMY2_9BACL|nr:YggT family protein [Scopulibacillus darangshiensis]TCP29106.1 YggT family protein [Scopulibacillus darangshiensis]